MKLLYKKRNSIRPGEQEALLTTWSPATEAEARADIARKYSQRVDGKIVNMEIARVDEGAQVSGHLFTWSASIPAAPALNIQPWSKCPTCEYRTPEQIEVCPRCETVIAQAVLV